MKNELNSSAFPSSRVTPTVSVVREVVDEHLKSLVLGRSR